MLTTADRAAGLGLCPWVDQGAEQANNQQAPGCGPQGSTSGGCGGKTKAVGAGRGLLGRFPNHSRRSLWVPRTWPWPSAPAAPALTAHTPAGVPGERP